MILNPNEQSKELLYNLGKQMLEMRKPNVWNVFQPENMEIMMEVDFEKFLIAVSEHTNEKIDDISTFRFYALIDFLKEKYKPTT